MQAVATTRFRPAQRHGTPVAVNLIWLFEQTTVRGKSGKIRVCWRAPRRPRACDCIRGAGRAAASHAGGSHYRNTAVATLPRRVGRADHDAAVAPASSVSSKRSSRESSSPSTG